MPHWDAVNADCIVIMGSNMAENHPIAFRFVMEAKAKGATVIHVDPRFTRTSAVADIYAPLRVGSDIAFLGGLINYILENDLYFKEYALNYTNLTTIIDERFQDASQLDGLFSGWDEETKHYKYDSWQYDGQVVPSTLSDHYVQTTESFSDQMHRMTEGEPKRDPTLQDPHCVYQILRRHYAAYTPEMVERITGCPQGTFLRIAEAITQNSGRERTTTWCYAVGWTHHTTGVQMIRAAAMIQGLLGNVGRPGGGILALRGHCNIQGSTDIPTLYNTLPGYLPMPHARRNHATLKDYLAVEQVPTGFWHNFPKYAVSLLKAWYGEKATAVNDFGYSWLPKIDGDHSQMPMMMAMEDGTIKGMMLYGQNPMVGGPNSQLVGESLRHLDWLVVREAFENETATFWQHTDHDPSDIGTEIFLIPCALPGEKEGSITNTHRLIQWHEKIVEPPGDCRSELWFAYHLGQQLQALYADSTAERDAPIQNLQWHYPTSGVLDEPSAAAVLREINGYTVADGQQVDGFDSLKDDGSTASGCWLYSGVYPSAGNNRAQSRQPDGANDPGTHLNWAYAWPANRRTIYNRASADPDGQPWSERKKLVWWDGNRWQGYDNVDFDVTKAPDYRPDWDSHPTGMDALDGRDPFIMIADGKSSLFVPSGLKDGPLPTHYEPVESPFKNPLYGQQDNPAAIKWHRENNQYSPVGDPNFPYVMTTYRLTEHHAGGSPTRSVTRTAALQPQGFAEIPAELAAELGINNLDWVVISTARGQIETRALVTARLRPLLIDGQPCYQIGMPWHYGWQGYATGDIANVLTSLVADPNTTIHEGKAFTCNVRNGRLRQKRPLRNED